MKKNYILLYVCLLMGALLLHGCGSVRGGMRPSASEAEPEDEVRLSDDRQRRFDYCYLEALRLKAQRDYTSAFAMLQHCLEINPKAAVALYEMSQYYAFLKQPQAALSMLERAVESEPTNYWYCQGLSNLYLQQGENDKATRLLEEMLTRFPDKLDVPYTLLGIYQQTERYQQALGILNLLEERSGRSEQLTMEKFRLYQQLKDTKRAFAEIEGLVKEYPLDPRYHVVLGDAYLQAKRMDEAFECYRRSLALEPDNALAMYSLAGYYEATGQTELYRRQIDSLLLNRKVDPQTRISVMRQFIIENEQAGRDSTRVINLFDRMMAADLDEAEVPMLYAQYLMSKGMNRETVPVLYRVVDIDPTNSAARMMLLGEAVRKEDYKEVTRICEGGVQTNPDKLEFYFYLAIAYNQEKRTDDVIEVCRQALEHVTPESNKAVVSDFYTIMGDCYHTKDMNAEAFAAYDSSLVYKPDNIGALNNYAYYLSLEKRDLDKAEEMSYRTVKAEPNNATYLDTYAWILFEKGKYAEARIYIDQAIKNLGEDEQGVVTEHCGDIYYMSGDKEGALKFWQKAWDKGSRSKTLEKKIKLKKYVE